MSQLTTDCLNYIFEYLEDDKDTLYSCILVNRLWCEISVRFFWSDSSHYNTSNFRTLISCLPNESKEMLSKNGIIISTQHQNFQYLIMHHFVKSYQFTRFIRILKSSLKINIFHHGM